MGKKGKQKFFESEEKALNMLIMAKSDLSLAKAGTKTEGILLETLCSQCHNAIEKALKSLMAWNVGYYYFGHSINELIKEMENEKINLPEDIKSAAIGAVTIEGGFTFPLTFPYNFGTLVHSSDYSGYRRYHFPDNPIPEQDSKRFIERAEKIVNWVEQQMR
jgi:HEPN domain-containing protein